MSVALGYLLDTCVISALAPRVGLSSSPQRSRIASWIERNGDASYLSIVTVLEIRVGARKELHRGMSRRAEDLERWLGGLVETFGRRVLPLNDAIVSRGCDTLGQMKAKGLDPGAADVLIAVTALHHGLSVATLNHRHFAPMMVELVDPSRSE